VYSIDNSRFTEPTLTALPLAHSKDDTEIINERLREKFLALKIKRLYAHTGPGVFGAHMELSGLDKVLLLPVERNNGATESMTTLMGEVFRNDSRFIFGCSIPHSITDDEIAEYMKGMVNRFNVKAVKLHPNVMQIDPSSKPGGERIEGILCACSQFDLSLVVHGGRSPSVRHSNAGSYALIDNLNRIDWAQFDTTVVIAHAGSYEYDQNLVENDVLPVLKRMLLKHNNLMIDISGLKVGVLIHILRNIDIDRIVFGSDALYESQWSRMVKLIYALKETGGDFENDLIRIMNINPVNSVFKDE
jgi:predicted TIM-barrel fold metal-dependent hydrolase